MKQTTIKETKTVYELETTTGEEMTFQLVDTFLTSSEGRERKAPEVGFYLSSENIETEKLEKIFVSISLDEAKEMIKGLENLISEANK